MNWLLALLALAVALAIFKALVFALVAAVLLALVVSFATRPSGTLVFIGALGLLSLASARPAAFIVTVGLVAVVVAVVGARRGASSLSLLTDGRERRSN